MELDKDIKQKLKDYTNKAPQVKTVIHWWDLYKGHYIKLKPDLQKQIFKKAIKKAGGHFAWLGEKLKISRRTIAECWKLKRNPQISTLIKVATFINFPLSKIEKNVIQLSKSKFKPNLPFKFHNPEGAEIRAAFLSDGHLSKYPEGIPQYLASEYFLHKRLIKLCKSIFGDFNVHTYFDGKTYVTKFPSGIGSALEVAGVPRGDKRIYKTSVPRDILTGSKEIQTAYLRRVFDDEGDVCFDKHGKRAVRLTRSIDITSKKLNLNLLKPGKWMSINNSAIPINTLLLGEQLLLYKLGIDARIYYEGVYKSQKDKITAKWRIQVGQQDSLRKFAGIIAFNLKSKLKKLSDALKSYKVKEFPNGEAEKFAIKVLNPIYKKRGYFFFGDLGKELVKISRGYDLAGYYLKILTEERIVKKVKRGKYVFLN